MASTIAITCPKCEKQIKAPAELVGKKIKCKECLYVFVVQAPRAPKGGARAAKGAAQDKAAKAAAAKPPPADDDEEGSTPYEVTDHSMLPHCAYCAKEMEEGQVVCLHCGYNHHTRERAATKKTYETTGGQQFLWLLPGILCALGVLLMIGLIVLFFTVFRKFEDDFKDDWWSIFFGLWARLWGSVICLFIAFFLGRFAVKRLIMHPTAPEREKHK